MANVFINPWILAFSCSKNNFYNQKILIRNYLETKSDIPDFQSVYKNFKTWSPSQLDDLILCEIVQLKNISEFPMMETSYKSWPLELVYGIDQIRKNLLTINHHSEEENFKILKIKITSQDGLSDKMVSFNQSGEKNEELIICKNKIRKYFLCFQSYFSADSKINDAQMKRFVLSYLSFTCFICYYLNSSSNNNNNNNNNNVLCTRLRKQDYHLLFKIFKLLIQNSQLRSLQNKKPLQDNILNCQDHVTSSTSSSSSSDSCHDSSSSSSTTPTTSFQNNSHSSTSDSHSEKNIWDCTCQKYKKKKRSKLNKYLILAKNSNSDSSCSSGSSSSSL